MASGDRSFSWLYRKSGGSKVYQFYFGIRQTKDGTHQYNPLELAIKNNFVETTSDEEYNAIILSDGSGQALFQYPASFFSNTNIFVNQAAAQAALLAAFTTYYPGISAYTPAYEVVPQTFTNGIPINQGPGYGQYVPNTDSTQVDTNQLIDYGASGPDYIGILNAGAVANPANPVWLIKKLSYNGSNQLIQTQFAYNAIWNNRASLIYE
jgi:hypothetical protein